MGMFSGGFFGGGTDESSSTTNNTTTVDTTTITTVGDIGLTGADAVMLTREITDASIVNTNILSGAAQNISVQSRLGAEAGYKALTETGKTILAGLKDLTRSTQAVASDNLYTTRNVSHEAIRSTVDVVDKMLEANAVNSKLTTNAQTELFKTLQQAQNENYDKLLTITGDTTNPALSLGKDIVTFGIIGVIAAMLFLRGRN
jgi:hypothetical protein